MSEPQRSPVEADIDDAVTEAIAACGGDPRATVRALLADNAALTKELDFASLTMSYGFSRGWFARQREARQQQG